MGIQAIKWAFNLAPQCRSAEQQMVLMVLADCYNDETGKCFPTQQYISEKINVTARSIRNALNFFEDQGWIQRNPGKGRGNASEITLQFDAEIKEENRKTGKPEKGKEKTGKPEREKPENRKEEAEPPTPPLKEEPEINQKGTGAPRARAQSPLLERQWAESLGDVLRYPPLIRLGALKLDRLLNAAAFLAALPGSTTERLAEFAAQRRREKKPLKLEFIESDYADWLARNAAAPPRASPLERSSCGNCRNGWITDWETRTDRRCACNLSASGAEVGIAA